MKNIKRILVIGSGPIVIGQAAEFDYAGTQACKSLKEEGCYVILVNSNPATIMTDVDTADKVYVEPLTIEIIEKIIIREKPDGILGTLGGQTGLNLVKDLYDKKILEKHGVKKIESLNQKFDHNFHQAMMEVENNDVEEGTVVQEVQSGYTMHDRLLRAAMVGVSKKPVAKTEEPTEEKEEDNPENESKEKS